jgi:GTP-binding protein
MPQLTFSKCTFLASAYEEDQLPELKMTEVAIVGRSNVGKSSLINALFNGKKLAKVSSTPGKTASINFFCIDDQFCLVDLPGYGYAKVNESTKKKWSMLIEAYLNKRKTLRLILLLLDSRRLLSEQDKTFITWAAHHEIPILFIFTKTDKLKEGELKRSIAQNLTLLHPFFPDPHFLQYSIKQPRAKIELINRLNDFFYGRSK